LNPAFLFAMLHHYVMIFRLPTSILSFST
jgi:hypothetical protein